MSNYQLNTIYEEVNKETMARMQDGLCNLIITSPPYADARKDQYGGPPPDEFIDWFRPMAVDMKRVLAKDGSLIINIGDCTKDGETHLFTWDLPIMMKRELGFCFIESFIWHKKTCPPGKFPNRFKDAWEFIYHFAHTPKIKFYPDRVREKAKAQSLERENRARNMVDSETGSGFRNGQKKRRERANGSGFGTNDAAATLNGDTALPSNVLYLAPETQNMGHSAVFPVELPTFYIKCLTDEGDVVYDPFMGSGTVGEVSARLNRPFLGSEPLHKHWIKANKRVQPFIQNLFTK